jgi:hypothetical protein
MRLELSMLKIRYGIGMMAIAVAVSGAAHAVPHISLRAPQAAIYQRVSQPTPGAPVRLHGVIDKVDPANHRLDIGQLQGFEYFWGPTVHNCAVDPQVDISALRPGIKVEVTLSRNREKEYYVSAIERD